MDLKYGTFIMNLLPRAPHNCNRECRRRSFLGSLHVQCQKIRDFFRRSPSHSRTSPFRRTSAIIAPPPLRNSCEPVQVSQRQVPPSIRVTEPHQTRTAASLLSEPHHRHPCFVHLRSSSTPATSTATAASSAARDSSELRQIRPS